MAKKDIQTNLLGREVRPQFEGRMWWPEWVKQAAEKGAQFTGRIQSVYLDPEGEPKYTIEVSGQLCDVWGHAFKLVPAPVPPAGR